MSYIQFQSDSLGFSIAYTKLKSNGNKTDPVSYHSEYEMSHKRLPTQILLQYSSVKHI
jgi:hypothetical protein